MLKKHRTIASVRKNNASKTKLYIKPGRNIHSAMKTKYYVRTHDTKQNNLRDWSAKELLVARAAPPAGGRAPIRRDGATLTTPAQL